MAKVRIDWDEWYPVYFTVNKDGSYYGDSNEEFEISDEDLAFIQKASADFHDAQKILEKLVHPNGRY